LITPSVRGGRISSGCLSNFRSHPARFLRLKKVGRPIGATVVGAVFC
jgi:hypothetical protein